MYYHSFNAPIQTNPAVYLTFWGDWSSAGDPQGAATLLRNYLTDVGGSDWNNTVTEYCQNGYSADFTTCPIGSTNAGNPKSMLKGVWFDPSTPVYNSLAQEALNSEAHFGAPAVGAVNVQYVIAVARNGTVDEEKGGFGSNDPVKGFCAWHDYATANDGTRYPFTNLPYQSDVNNCGSGSGFGSNAGFTILEGHELAETETDPYLDAWSDANGLQGEIGDKCVWITSGPGAMFQATMNGHLYASQSLWGNALGNPNNSCLDTTAPTFSVSLSSNVSSVPVNTPVTLTATTNVDVGGTTNDIQIYDLSNNTRVADCSSGTSCSLTATRSAATTVSYVAYVASPSVSYPPPAYRTYSPQVSVGWQGAWAVTLSASATNVPHGTEADFTATASSSVSSTGLDIEIFDVNLNFPIVTCNAGTTCSGGITYTAGGIANFVAYVASPSKTNPPPGIVATSNQVTVTWGVSVTMWASANTVPANKGVELTATASQDVRASGAELEIYDVTNNSLVADCTDGVNCYAGMSRSTSQTDAFIAYVAQHSATNPPPGVLGQSGIVDVAWWSVSLTASPNPQTTSGAINLTAYIGQDVAASGLNIEIYDAATGQRVALCSSGGSCSVTVSDPAQLEGVPLATCRTYIADIAGLGSTYPPPGVVVESSTVARWTFVYTLENVVDLGCSLFAL